jgi:hypothetical protein
MIPTEWLRVVSVLCLALFHAAANAQSSAAPTAAEVAQGLRFSTSEIRRIESGDVISKPLNEGSENELAGVVAVFFRKPLAELADLAIQGKTLETDKDVRAFRSWKPGDPLDGPFAELGLGADETSEAECFAKASAGDRLNLSTSETLRFKNVPPTTQAVNVILRAVLKERYLAYVQNGLKGVKPYARGRAFSSPADELTLAIRETMTAAPRVDFFNALLKYPVDQPDDIEHKYYWFKQIVEDRPTFVLAHVSMRRSERGAVITEQQFYVSHSYNSNFVAGGCLSVEGGTLVFYVNRTFTDQVAGFGAAAKHRIGRTQMLSEVAAKLKQTRESMQE